MPEAEPLVSSFRGRYLAGSVARGIPPHITLLIPYVSAARLDVAAIESAREHFRGVARFDAELVGVGRFEEHVWLAPAPRVAFVELIRSTCRWYPESPYGMEFPDPVPHVTVGEANDEHPLAAILDAARVELAPSLPLPFRANSASLLVEQADGMWEQTETFAFAA